LQSQKEYKTIRFLFHMHLFLQTESQNFTVLACNNTRWKPSNVQENNHYCKDLTPDAEFKGIRR